MCVRVWNGMLLAFKYRFTVCYRLEFISKHGARKVERRQTMKIWNALELGWCKWKVGHYCKSCWKHRMGKVLKYSNIAWKWINVFFLRFCNGAQFCESFHMPFRHIALLWISPECFTCWHIMEMLMIQPTINNIFRSFNLVLYCRMCAVYRTHKNITFHFHT